MKMLTFAAPILAVCFASLSSFSPVSETAPHGSGSAYIDSGTLLIYGTELNDRVQLYADSDPDKFSFRLNGLLYRFNSPDQVLVYLGEGDDRLTSDFDGQLTQWVVVYGQEGRDRLHDRVNNIDLFGGDGDDLLITSGSSTYRFGFAYGEAGNDVLYGGPGDTDLIGGPGNDEIYGGTGIDYVDGGDGDDLLYGGAGDDYLSSGTTGEDILIGGTGNDELMSGWTQDDAGDFLFGGSGNDALYGGWLGSEFYGGPGDDEIYGTQGDDYMIGGPGNDEIYTDAGNDYVSCGAGNDTVYADIGMNMVYGNAGDDELYGSEESIIRQ